MRWPFGPPHLTLKPSTKNKKQKNKKKQEEKEAPKKAARIPKIAFQLSVISQLSLFLGGFSKFSFFDTLAQKARAQKTL